MSAIAGLLAGFVLCDSCWGNLLYLLHTYSQNFFLMGTFEMSVLCKIALEDTALGYWHFVYYFKMLKSEILNSVEELSCICKLSCTLHYIFRITGMLLYKRIIHVCCK